jgi:hypothetical protein
MPFSPEEMEGKTFPVLITWIHIANPFGPVKTGDGLFIITGQTVGDPFVDPCGTVIRVDPKSMVETTVRFAISFELHQGVSLIDPGTDISRFQGSGVVTAMELFVPLF